MKKTQPSGDSVKEVGILTRHIYPNYGSLLQTHALATAVTASGGRSCVIDYVPPADRPWRLAASSLQESRMRSSLAKRAAYLAIQTPNLAGMSLRFRGAQRRLLNLTRTYSTGNDVARASEGLDLVLAGSDQIWNTIHGDLDPVYFLDGIPSRKRFSYAASFGTEAPANSNRARVTSWLQKFGEVSVRERSAQASLATAGIRARVDVDPVLLHDRTFWSQFAERTPAADGKYILVYQLHNTPDFDRRLRIIEDRHRLPVRRITPDAKMFVSKRASDYLASPERFVGLFRDAEAVVTDSFHGTAFSLVFGRPLYALLPERNTTRNTDLLESVGIVRLASVAGNDPTYDPTYDADAVAAELRALADDSWRYLEALTARSDAL
ncbi:polysaccharide pyruvyl transferase family protein [Prescottella equi]|uniref:polysaccharide pyruvyl transferase family protein n=1 Tax=Rhodococcus hoagii TaxID=43767 RepID=UPI001C853623|nr:polysaccharide pyruvyl transferase family protein [Prescottella equi]